MGMNWKKLEDFKLIFFPRAIAVVGASEEERKPGTMYLKGLLRSGFKGPIYPVNLSGDEVLGLKVYRRVSDIPGPVDYVSVYIPKHSLLDLLEDCARKGVKAVQMFTAGFSETGLEEDRRLEEEMVKVARRAGLRIIGPNCIGVSCSSHRTCLGPDGAVSEVGRIAFITQSGGQGLALLESGLARGIKFSKVISFGNGSDLDSSDYLEYLAVDPETEIIGAYLEGVKEGRRFLSLLKETSKTKPVVVWKGGRTAAGAETAASHTGSLAGAAALWAAALKQARAVEVASLEELADTLLAFQNLPPLKGNRVAIVAGLIAGGGGASVSSSDACVSQGLEVPQLSPEIRKRLEPLIPPAGRILRNPVDMSVARASPQVLARVLEILAADLDTNLLIVCASTRVAIHAFPGDVWEALCRVLLDFHKTSPKPLALFSASELPDPNLDALEGKLAAAGIPIFPTLERAARAVANVSRYWSQRLK